MADRNDWAQVPSRRRDNRRQGQRRPYQHGPSRQQGQRPRYEGGQGPRGGHRFNNRPSNREVRNVTRGTALTNFFEMNVSKCPTVYQYVVSIERKDTTAEGKEIPGATFKERTKKDPIEYNRSRVHSFLDKTLARDIVFAYDGRETLYTLGRELPSQVLRKDIQVEDNYTCSQHSGFVKVKIMPANEALLKEGEEPRLKEIKYRHEEQFSRALNFFFAESAFSNNFLGLQRSFFHPTNGNVIESNKYRHHQNGHVRSKANRGFYQSTRSFNTNYYLNFVDSLAALWDFSANQGMNSVETMPDNSMHLPSFLAKLRGGPLQVMANDDNWWTEISKELKGLEVRTIHNFRTFHLVRFKGDSNSIKFTHNEKEVSVRQYFRTQYGKQLQQATLPCAEVRPGNHTLIPIEMLVVLKNQRRGEFMDDNEKRAFIDKANKEPKERKSAIQNMLASLDPHLQTMCNNLNIDLKRSFLKVDVDILKHQSVEYGQGVTVSAAAGFWKTEKNYKFITPMEMKKWVIINLDGAQDVGEFRQYLITAARSRGMYVNDRGDNVINCRMENVEEKLGDQKQSQIVIIRSKQKLGSVYSKVKTKGDIELKVLTQVSIVQRRQNPKYYENLVMKINTKLGGTNFTPRCQPAAGGSGPSNDLNISGDVMVVGLDVTHAASCGQSVAAVVGSMDDQFMQYCGRLHVQENSKEEIVASLGDIFKELVEKRKKLTGKSWPKAVIIFRDGVSEGQYEKVKSLEIQSIRDVYGKSSVAFQPKITGILITKRHHSRFFKDEQDPESRNIFDRTENIIPGAVIQDPITLTGSGTVIHEFYLNSHEGVKGTNKPCRYTVIQDDNDIDPKSLQLFAYRLCHGFARCCKPVSMANAAYYAHLLAYRGRIYLASSENSEKKSNEKSEERTRTINVKNIPDNLFFV